MSRRGMQLSRIPGAARPDRRRRIRVITLLTGIWCFVSGCLYVPTSDQEPMSGREVKREELALLQPQRTTKAEVTERFGAPTVFWRDENVLIYRWVKRRGVLLWAVASGYAANFGAIDVPQESAFLLKFDAQDRLVKSEIREKPANQSYGDFLLQWRDGLRREARSPDPKL